MPLPLRLLALAAALSWTAASPWYSWGALELSPIAKDNAIAFMQALEERKGAKLGPSEMEKISEATVRTAPP